MGSSYAEACKITLKTYLYITTLISLGLFHTVVKIIGKKNAKTRTEAAVMKVHGCGGAVGVTAGSSAGGCGNSQVSRRSPGLARISRTRHFNSRCPTITEMHCLPPALLCCPLTTPMPIFVNENENYP